MGMTMAEKILAAHAGAKHVEPGQFVEVNVDVVLANDITALSPFGSSSVSASRKSLIGTE